MYLPFLVQFEILFVNLAITYLISNKKYSLKVTISSLIFVTLGIIVLFTLLKPDNTPVYFTVLIGISYIIPLTLLFKESLLKMSTIMFFCWTQTMIILKFSKLCSALINDNSNVLPLILQTVLLTVAFPFLVKYAKNVYKVIIEGISKDSFNILMLLTVVLFSITLIFTYFLNGLYLVFVLLLLLEITTLSVYILLRDFVVNSKRVLDLNKIAFTDSLTQLDNRFSLFARANRLVEEEIPFHCIYMDLDDFKGINDEYGHYVGDQYLQHFVSSVLNSIDEQCKAYRLGGDEFILILEGDMIDLSLLKSNIETHFHFTTEFRGVSIGSSTYLKDGNTLDELLDAADSKMYKRKIKTKYRESPRIIQK